MWPNPALIQRAGSRASSPGDHSCRRGSPARQAHELPPRPPRFVQQQRGSQAHRTGTPTDPRAEPRARTRRRGVAPGCADRCRRPCSRARRASDPTPRRRGRECWPRSRPSADWSAQSRHSGCCRSWAAPAPRRVEHGHPQINTVAQFGLGKPHPLHGMTGQRFIQQGHDGRIDILCARDDRRDHPKINRPSGELRHHRRQIVPQRPGIPDLPRRPRPADVLRRRHLGGPPRTDRYARGCSRPDLWRDAHPTPPPLPTATRWPPTPTETPHPWRLSRPRRTCLRTCV